MRPLQEIVARFRGALLRPDLMPEAAEHAAHGDCRSAEQCRNWPTPSSMPGRSQTRDMLVRFFARPDIRAQLRDDALDTADLINW